MDLSIERSPYAGEADLQAIADVFNACEAVDQLEEGASVEELRVDFDSPIFDKQRDFSLWRDATRKLLGFGKLWIPDSGETVDGRLVAWKVLPSARSSDLALHILAWAETTLREVGEGAGKPITLHLRIQERAAEPIALLNQQGFSIDRYFFTMARSLAAPIPEPVLPVGFTLRQTNGEADAEAWVAMFNESFIDHWNFHPMPIEDFYHELTDPNYRSDLDVIAIAPDGSFAAFCYGCIYPEENRRSGRNDGWIEVLGSRRGFRKIGLGRTMLRVGLQRLQAAGAETARLNVDAESPTGATRLYESEGFHPVETRVSYVKYL